jgi:hypothetical protein
MASYCFDIDGTLFKTYESNYQNSQPISHRITLVNKLYDEGNEITLFTARGTVSGIDWRELTEKQLKEGGFDTTG